jgi:trigger factor
VDKLLPIDRALDHLTLPKDSALTFACELELKPEFELPKLDKIPVSRPKVTVSDDDVETELRRMQTFRGTFEPVEDGPIELDDLLYADVKMTVGNDVLVNEQNTDLAARDIRIKGIPLTGLGEALAGKNREDVVEFEATVPDDHENLDLRGKTARFEITIREIKRLALPPIDDAFLEATGYGSEDELRDALRQGLERRLDQVVRDRMHEQVADYLIAQTPMEIPEGLSHRQTERTVARRMIELYRAGIPEAEIHKAADEMRSKAHDQVIRDLRLYFILEKIAEDREIQVTEEQLNSAIASMAQRTGKRFDRVRDELSKGEGLNMLYVQLRDQLALDQLVAEAEVTETAEEPRRAPSKPRIHQDQSSNSDQGQTDCRFGNSRAKQATGQSGQEIRLRSKGERDEEN